MTVNITVVILSNYLKRHSITSILTFPLDGGRDWIPAFAGMTVE